jgi:acyl homoserine lactone synthase
MLGVLEIGLCSGLEHIAGVFDARMIRVYRRVGWGPTILGSDGTGRDAISAGLWPCDEAYRARLLARAGVSDEVSRHWLARAWQPTPIAA